MPNPEIPPNKKRKKNEDDTPIHTTEGVVHALWDHIVTTCSNARACKEKAIHSARETYEYKRSQASAVYLNYLNFTQINFLLGIFTQADKSTLISSATSNHMTTLKKLEDEYNQAVIIATTEYELTISKAKLHYLATISHLTDKNSDVSTCDSLIQAQSTEPKPRVYGYPDDLLSRLDNFHDDYVNIKLLHESCSSEITLGYQLKVFNITPARVLLKNDGLVFALEKPCGENHKILSITATINNIHSKPMRDSITTDSFVSHLSKYTAKSNPSLQLYYLTKDDVQRHIINRLFKSCRPSINFTVTLSITTSNGQEKIIKLTTNPTRLFSKIPDATAKDIPVAGKRMRDTSDESSTESSSDEEPVAASAAGAAEDTSIARLRTPSPVSRPPVAFAGPPTTPNTTTTTRADYHSRSPGVSNPFGDRTEEPLGRAYSNSPDRPSTPLSGLVLNSPQGFYPPPLGSPDDFGTTGVVTNKGRQYSWEPANRGCSF